MAQQTINIGASPNDGTGTPLRTSFDYTNQNFTELYTAVGPSGNNIVVPGSATITGDLTVDTSTLKVDSANDRVGIQSTLLNSRLTVRAGTIAGIDIYRDDANANFAGIRFKGTANSTVNAQIGWNGTQLRLEGTDEFLCATNSSDRFRISSTGVFTFETVGGVAGTAMTLNATGLGIGVAPITSHILSFAGPVAISGTNSGTRTSYITNSGACAIYYSDGGGSGYFTDFGNLIIQPRTSADRSVVIATGSTTPVERAVVKSTGQVRFVPLAADPAGAESGDVYYNSSSNKLKCYNGTTWNDLF